MHACNFTIKYYTMKVFPTTFNMEKFVKPGVQEVSTHVSIHVFTHKTIHMKRSKDNQSNKSYCFLCM